MKVDTMAATTISPATTVYWFRGQPCESWSLEPALTRIARKRSLIPDETLDLERTLMTDFQTEVHRFLSPAMIPDTDYCVDWWTIMQYHGAPTRLLGWTRSLLVATYFAVEQCPGEDGAVWMFNIHALRHGVAKYGNANLEAPENKGLKPRFRDPSAPYLLMYLVRPGRMKDRMAAQQTCFTMAAHPLVDHRKTIEAVFSQRPGA
jgi:hypothetical protein